MNVEEFLAETPAAGSSSLPAAGVAPVSTEASTGTQGDSPEVAPQVREDRAPEQPAVLAGGASVSEAPTEEPVQFTALTPSGIEVLYQAAPKRLYRVRRQWVPTTTKDVSAAGEWVEVPSVTTVLGVLDKAALPWWGMKMGVEGVLELAKRGLIREMKVEAPLGTEHAALMIPGQGMVGSTMLPADVDNVVDLLNQFKLTVNHKRDKAGDRGQSVHDAFEAWAKDDIWPQPEVFPATERGYVEGLVRFLEDAAIEPGGTEIMVGSLEHGFAGRYDLRAIMADSNLCTKLYPKRADKYELVPGGSCLLDLKTSAGVYDTHEFQLEAYEAASVECGYTPTDFRAVIRVSADGRYEFVQSKSTFEDFLGVKAAYDARESRKRRKKRPK